VEKFKAARLQCVSEVQKHYNSDHRGGEHTTYFIDDSVGSDGVPPSLGHYEEGRQALPWVGTLTWVLHVCGCSYIGPSRHVWDPVSHTRMPH
jgi:hypothetical protein